MTKAWRLQINKVTGGLSVIISTPPSVYTPCQADHGKGQKYLWINENEDGRVIYSRVWSYCTWGLEKFWCVSGSIWDNELLTGLSESVLVATWAGTGPDRSGRSVHLAEAGIYQVGAIRDHELFPSFTKANFPGNSEHPCIHMGVSSYLPWKVIVSRRKPNSKNKQTKQWVTSAFHAPSCPGLVWVWLRHLLNAESPTVRGRRDNLPQSPGWTPHMLTSVVCPGGHKLNFIPVFHSTAYLSNQVNCINVQFFYHSVIPMKQDEELRYLARLNCSEGIKDTTDLSIRKPLSCCCCC